MSGLDEKVKFPDCPICSSDNHTYWECKNIHRDSILYVDRVPASHTCIKTERKITTSLCISNMNASTHSIETILEDINSVSCNSGMHRYFRFHEDDSKGPFEEVMNYIKKMSYIEEVIYE